MKLQRLIAVLLSALLLGSTLSSCKDSAGDGKETSSDMTDTGAEVDTSEVVPSDEKKYDQELDAGVADMAENAATDFEYEVSEGAVVIQKYIGSDVRCKIPAQIDGVAVKAIADGAFAENETLAAVVIPEGVTSIGASVFADCDALRVLHTPLLGKDAASDQFLGYLFGANTYENNSRDVPASLKLLHITGGQESLQAFSLYDCNDLVCVVLPDSMRVLEEFSLYNCASLKQIVNIDRVSELESHALAHCSSLPALHFGNGLSTIGLGALEGCLSLQILTLPFVGGSATENTYLGYIFGAKVPDFAKGYYPTDLEKVILLEGCQALGDYAFYECTTLKELVLPEGIAQIGVRAFYDCNALWSITLPNSLVRIRESAFFGCESLLRVNFGESLSEIGINAFYHCENLESITLPASLKSLPASCFAGCISLQNVDLGGVTAVGKQAFRNCNRIQTATAAGEVTLENGNEYLRSALYPEES